MREDWKRNLPLSGRITCKWPFLTNWDRKGHQSQYQRVSRYVAMLLAGFVRKSGELPKPGNGFQATFVHPVSASNRVKWPWYAMIGHDMGPNFRTNHDLCNATTCCLRLGLWSSAWSDHRPCGCPLKDSKVNPSKLHQRHVHSPCCVMVKEKREASWGTFEGKTCRKVLCYLKPTQSYNYFCWLRVWECKDNQKIRESQVRRCLSTVYTCNSLISAWSKTFEGIREVLNCGNLCSCMNARRVAGANSCPSYSGLRERCGWWCSNPRGRPLQKLHRAIKLFMHTVHVSLVSQSMGLSENRVSPIHIYIYVYIYIYTYNRYIYTVYFFAAHHFFFLEGNPTLREMPD